MTDVTNTDLDARVGVMFQEVLRQVHLGAPEALAGILAEEVQRIGVDSLTVYVVDYEQQTLIPVPSPDAPARTPLSIRGTMAGRAFASTNIVEVEVGSAGGRRLWVPLLDGTERIGVLLLTVASGEPIRDALRAACERYAHFIALLLVSKSLYTDYFERLRRTRPMTVASELIWELVPPLVLASGDFVLSPCSSPATTSAAMPSTTPSTRACCTSPCSTRWATATRPPAWPRSPSPRIGTAECAATGQPSHTRRSTTPWPNTISPSRFVTALIAELELATGQLRWVSAGHPAPLLLRDGRLVKTLDVTPSPPLALQLAAGPPAEGSESLEPGDMFLLYTDGLTEARRPGGELFTVERLGEFIEREAAGGRAAPETLRQLREAIIERGAARCSTTRPPCWSSGAEPARAILPATV